MSIAPNPSHLEAVNPVVMGLVRALQTRLGHSGQQRVAGLLIHGDAAFAALGIVTECLQLANTPGIQSLPILCLANSAGKVHSSAPLALHCLHPRLLCSN